MIELRRIYIFVPSTLNSLAFILIYFYEQKGDNQCTKVRVDYYVQYPTYMVPSANNKVNINKEHLINHRAKESTFYNIHSIYIL